MITLILFILIVKIITLTVATNHTLTTGSKITVLISEQDPFVIFSKRNQAIKPNGLDIFILDAFASKFNLKIEYIKIEKSLNLIFDSHVMTKKFFEDQINRSIDIFAVGLNENLITRKYLVASQTYYHDRLIWCLSKQIVSPMKKVMIFIKDPHIFVPSFLSLALLGTLFGYIMFMFEPKKMNWNNILINEAVVFIGISIKFDLKSNAYRIAFIALLFCGMIFTATSRAKMEALTMKTVYSKRMDSIKKILGKGYDFYGNQIAHSKLLNLNEVSKGERTILTLNLNIFIYFFLLGIRASIAQTISIM